MPVGEMLRRMDSREITEWRAYFALKADGDKPKGTPADRLKAMFAHRVVQKE